MKIKTKLYALAIISTLAILLSVGVFIGFQNYTNKILDEQRELIVLRELMFRQNITLSKLINNNTPLINQRKLLDENIEETNKLLITVTESKILPTLNSSTKKAFSSIGKLDVLLKSAYLKLDISLDAFMANFDATDVTYSIKIIERYKNRSNYTRMLLDANNVVKDGFSVELALDASSDILTEQSVIIENVIASYQNIARIITLSVVAFSIIISALFAFSLSNKISKSITILGTSLSVMAKGDFTHDIIINTKDELGHLGNEMSTFQNDLNVSLNRIKDSSEENKKANIGLVKTTADASDVTVDVSLNIESVNNRMKTLASNIEEANVGMTSIFDFTNTLNNFTTEQMAMVEESTAAITEMIASISSISDLTNNNTDVIKKLELTAVEGDKKLSDTTDIIEEINSTVSDINSMSEIIKNISEQTNLLAMNAAIEAAHAGDAGKGFAVVADEIRKLAEASSLNSQDISKNLDEITHKIEMASVSGVSTREAFTDIYEKIKNVSNALLQVASSTSELDTGGAQILEAMEGLKEISINVQEKSSEMKDVSSSVSSVSSDISNISKSVTEDLAGVYTGFNDVTNAMVSLNDVSDKVEAVSKEINVEVLKFKTK